MRANGGTGGVDFDLLASLRILEGDQADVRKPFFPGIKHRHSHEIVTTACNREGLGVVGRKEIRNDKHYRAA